MIRRPQPYAKTLKLLACLFIFGTCALAQEPAPPTQQPTPQTLKVKFLAYTEKGKTTAELKREDVHVYVDGAERPVTYFAREESSVSYGLVVDNSGSLHTQINAVIAAADFIAKNNGPSDETFVVRFVSSDEIKVMQEFTNDKNAISDALHDMFIEGGQTALLDAVYLSGQYVTQKSRADANAPRRRALVLVTDGDDRASYYRTDQVLKVLRAGGVQVFAVGLTADLDRIGLITQSKRDKAKSLLEKLTSETGGRVFFAEKVAELKDAVEEIVRDLHAEYVVGYEAPAPDNRKHKIEVKAFGPDGTEKLKVVLRPEPEPQLDEKQKNEEKQKKKKS